MNNETSLGIRRTRNGLDWRFAFKAARDLANEIAPNRRTRDAFKALEYRLREDGHSPESRLRGFLGRVQDGLQYGNWPTDRRCKAEPVEQERRTTR